MFKSKYRPVLVFVCVIASICRTSGQVFEFPDPIKYDKTCGLDHLVGQWSVGGSVTLTSQDLVTFEPKVIIQTSSKTLCTIDLTSCSPRSTSTVDTCYCTHTHNDVYGLYIRRRPRLSQSGLMLRATTPSRNVCVPTPVSTDIGVLPVVYNQPQVTYQVDDGPEEIMTTFQNISVREDDYVTFTFCVSNLLPGYTLTFDLAGQEGKTRDGCVKVIYRFNFQVTESVKAKVKYQEHIGCERTASLAVSIIPGDPNDDSGETPIKNVKAIHQPLIPPDTCNKRENSSPRELITLKNGRKVVCDTETDGGGWIIFQHRESGDVDFYRGWHEYKTGFGVLEGDFWFGLKYIHKMCHLDHQCELRIELRYNRTSKFATYGSFSISGEHDNYRLFISGYHGDAGDALTQHNGMAFTTKDKDNDKNSKGNCAQSHIGAWWYAICLHSNLNGKWGTAGWKGPVWKTFTGNNPATFTEMKVRLMSNSDKTSTWH